MQVLVRGKREGNRVLVVGLGLVALPLVLSGLGQFELQVSIRWQALPSHGCSV
jgi:hypothetical protein